MKVSFRDNFKDIQTFNDKVTVVTLTGRFDMPEWWNRFPHTIYEWCDTHPSVSVNESFGTSEIILVAHGKALCHSEDTFDKVTGERIAEARAKIRIYKFMHTLLDKLMKHYFSLMYGKDSEMSAFFHGKDFDSSLYKAVNRYQELMIKESHHLGELLKEV